MTPASGPEQRLALVSLVVRHDDAAIAFLTDALRFALVEDTPLGLRRDLVERTR